MILITPLEWYSQRLVRKELLEGLREHETGVISVRGEIRRFMNVRSYTGLDYIINHYLVRGFGLYRSIAKVRMPLLNNQDYEQQQSEFKANFWGKYFISMDFPIDLDCSSISMAVTKAKKIEQFLLDNSWFFTMKFSGQRGFHYEARIGISYPEMRNLALRIRETTGANIDMNIYNFRQMWRVPWSMHQKSGLIAIPLNNVHEFNETLPSPENALKSLLNKHYPTHKT